MITVDPFNRVLAEKGLTISQLSQLSGISTVELYDFKKGRNITAHNVEQLCRILGVQPCELIEFVKTENKGHWEWVDETAE